jgi:excinuclease ABC subunit C
MLMAKDLTTAVRLLSHKPGVYIYKDVKGTVIYVGKAKDLRHRVSSYFQAGRNLAPDKALMVGRIAELETIVVSSELEALLLEGSLIKKYHPRFNIILRDDKYFTFIKLTLRDAFPQIQVVRRITKDGSRYFGPFTSAWRVRQTLKLIKRIFHYCTDVPPTGPRTNSKPCFDYHLGRCIGPCAGAVTSEAYHHVIRDIIRFLEGHTGDILNQLQRDMRGAAQRHAFEKAAILRDQLQSVERVVAQQKVISVKRDDADVLSLARDGDAAAVNLFQVRQGKLLQKEIFLLQHTSEAPETEIMASFVEQYYGQSTDHPKRVVMAKRPEGIGALERLLSIRIVAPNRGRLRQLVNLGEENSREELKAQRARWESDEAKGKRSLSALEKVLGLAPLTRLECYDISNNQGTNAVGSMVVFEAGQPKKSDYRKFSIKGVAGSDDFAMMAEVLRRRVRHMDDGGWPRPNLIIIDGGKGQLSAARDVLNDAGVKIPLISLAKREEEIFRLGIARPLVLPRDSEALFLLQRIRDEAHRFAIGAYRNKHGKATVKSLLDEIPGIGPRTKQTLLRKFGSVDGIRRAPEADIIATIGSERAETLFEHLA